jgi:hypothetical protein
MRGTRAGKAKKARLLAGNMIIQVDGTPTTTALPASIQPIRLGDKLLNQIINNSSKDVSNNRHGFSTQDDSLNELSAQNTSSNSHQDFSSSSNRMHESQNSFVSQGSAQQFTENSVNTNNQSVSTNGTSRKEKVKARRKLLRKKLKSIYLNSKDISFQEDISDQSEAISAELPTVIDQDCGKMHHINRRFHTLVSHNQPSLLRASSNLPCISSDSL